MIINKEKIKNMDKLKKKLKLMNEIERKWWTTV